ncbi:hypothetical protein C8J57DRAFT_1185055 [Mycena rebaudengoi]|nr:hypothetical protein C8J57DRAFT_1185055 [Mycena rebaudengoi]
MGSLQSKFKRSRRRRRDAASGLGPEATPADIWKDIYTTLKSSENHGMPPRAAVVSLLECMSAPRSDTVFLDTTPLHSRFQDRIETNYVPSDTERRELRDFCQQGRQMLSNIQWENAMVYATADHLNMMHSSIWTTLNPYEALISPMRTIPPEILQEIFIACLPADHGAIMHRSEVPLLLGLVCRTWRSISLCTPVLWSSVHIVVPEQNSNNAPRYRESTEMWLQRSGDCPLSITLSFPQYGSTAPEDSQSFMDIILPYRRRWKAMKFLSVAAEVMSQLHSLQPVEFPLLEAMEITDRENRTPLDFLSIPPRLRSITVIFRFSEISIPPCPWNQITILRLQSSAYMTFTENTVTIQNLMEALAYCVELRECHLGFSSGSESSAISTPSPTIAHITLRKLRVLSLSGPMWIHPTFSLETFLDHFILPALDGVLVGYEGTPWPGLSQGPVADICRGLESLVSRSPCNLGTLALNNIREDNMQLLIQCLRKCPSLLALCLRYSFNTRLSESDAFMILAALDPSPASATALCPILTSLSLQYLDTTDNTHSAIVALLRSRCQPSPSPTPLVQPLKHVEVNLRCRAAFDISLLTTSLYDSCGTQLYIQEPDKAFLPSRERSPWDGLPQVHFFMPYAN